MTEEKTPGSPPLTHQQRLTLIPGRILVDCARCGDLMVAQRSRTPENLEMDVCGRCEFEMREQDIAEAVEKATQAGRELERNEWNPMYGQVVVAIQDALPAAQAVEVFRRVVLARAEQRMQ